MPVLDSVSSVSSVSSASSASSLPTREWWRSAVIYQIYPRSFADANGDGMGDLAGVRSKLGYLSELGVDAIWLSPFYPSPQADAGYDVADYRDVDPVFGTLDDAKALIGDAHEHGLRIVVDIVPNHTSDQHVWFQTALSAPAGSAARNRYVFRDGRGDDGELPPNNWVSNFGGSAWTRVPDGQWYLHIFAPEQPDLNWTNPEVVDEFKDILRFWLDLGVDGFRIDVAHGLVKDPALGDWAGEHTLLASNAGDHPHWDRDEVHDVYRGWREVIDSYAGDRVFVAEAWIPNPDRFAQYLRSDELHTAFNFDFLEAGWNAPAMRGAIDHTLGELGKVGAPATWVLSNHDCVRHASRFGGGELGLRRAKAATLLTLALPGGAYLYQGEELGLEEVFDIAAELRQDPIFFRTQGERIGRDGCRVPLPWSGTEAPFGFGGSGEPWLPQPAAWAGITAAAQQDDPESTLNFYRAALAARRSRPELGDGTLSWVPTSSPEVLAFTRGSFACVINVRDEPVDVPTELAGGAVIVASAEGNPDKVAPASTVWLDLAG